MRTEEPNNDGHNDGHVPLHNPDRGRSPDVADRTTSQRAVPTTTPDTPLAARPPDAATHHLALALAPASVRPTATDHDRDSGARDLTHPPLVLSILGPTVLQFVGAGFQGRPWGAAGPSTIAHELRGPVGQVIEHLGPRTSELLTYLAAHPAGIHRDTLVATLWPNADPHRPTNSLRTTLTRLRQLLRHVHPDLVRLVIHRDGRYQLNGDLVRVDYWDLLHAATRISDPAPATQATACDTVISAYQGPLGADHDGEWLITLREATRRHFLDALTTLARLTLDDPERTLTLLESARTIDPLTEGVYRDIMRLQALLGRPGAAEATLALLRAQLADIGTAPEPATLALAAAITARSEPNRGDHRGERPVARRPAI